MSGQCLAQWLLENIPERILNDDEKSVLMKQKTKVCLSPTYMYTYSSYHLLLNHVIAYEKLITIVLAYM